MWLLLDLKLFCFSLVIKVRTNPVWVESIAVWQSGDKVCGLEKLRRDVGGHACFVFWQCLNTVLLLLSRREILWNCFRGAFKPLSFEMLFLKGSMSEKLKPIKKKKWKKEKEIGSSTHDPDILSRNASIFWTWFPIQDLMHFEHPKAQTVVVFCDVALHYFQF